VLLLLPLIVSSVSIPGGATVLPERSRTISFSSGSTSLTKLDALPGYRLTFKSRQTEREQNLHIPFPVYRFDVGDVNNDGNTDILLGVSKTTHFDPVVRRRLFVYRTGAGGLQPLWLGSRVCLALVDFRCIRHRAMTMVMTIEQEQDGQYCNGLYKWHDFGFELVQFINRETDYATARKNFDGPGSP
jgi:hypothetical protein